MVCFRAQAQHFSRFPNIHAGEDEFLDAESHELDPFHDLISDREGVRQGGLWGDGAEEKDGYRRVQEERIDDDHDKQAFDEAGVMKDEMQTRPEDQRLPGDGADPADNNERNGGIPRDILAEEEKNISADVWDQADRGDEQAPEVQAAAALEGGRAEHDQLDGIVVNKGCEGSEDEGDDGDITDDRKRELRHGQTCSIDLELALGGPTKSQESSKGSMGEHP